MLGISGDFQTEQRLTFARRFRYTAECRPAHNHRIRLATVNISSSGRRICTIALGASMTVSVSESEHQSTEFAALCSSMDKADKDALGLLMTHLIVFGQCGVSSTSECPHGLRAKAARNVQAAQCR